MIKNYKKFINESKHSFSIYDFLEWTREYSWSESIDKSDLVKYTEHFIGSGQWTIIEEHFDKIFKSLKQVDIDYVNDRLLDIFDEYPYHDMKYATCAVVYGDILSYNENNSQKLRGMMSVKEPSEQRKLNIIVNFLNKILSETLWIYDFKNSKMSRTSNDEIYVTSDKWSLKNFKEQELEIITDEEFISKNEYSMSKFLKIKNNFSIEKCLENYLPAIYISIGSYKFMSAKFSFNKIKKEFENILPSILNDIDYSEILWNWKLPEGKDDIEIYDYDFKILLNI